MNDELEANIENRIVKYVESIDGFALKLVLASESGFADRVIFLPSGLVIFIEIKRPEKSKTYFMQRQWRKRLQRRDFRYEFVESLEDVKRIIAEEQGKS